MNTQPSIYSRALYQIRDIRKDWKDQLKQHVNDFDADKLVCWAHRMAAANKCYEQILDWTEDIINEPATPPFVVLMEQCYSSTRSRVGGADLAGRMLREYLKKLALER